MRISTMQAFRSGLGGITNAQNAVVRTQEQVSSGRRVQSAADDPVAAARILRLQQDIAVREQYQQNIGSVENRLGYEDATLQQATDVLQRIRELAVQARGPALSKADREALAAEVGTRLEELVSVLNSRDGNGDFLFGGFQASKTPFQQDDTGRYIYSGDEGQRREKISESTTVAVTDSGKRLFVDVPAAATGHAVRALTGSSGEAKVTNVRITDQAALDAFFPDDIQIRFNDLTDVVPPSANFTVYSATDGRVLEGFDRKPYREGAGVAVAGLEMRIFGSPEPGDVFQVDTTQTQDVLTTVAGLEQGLRRFDDSAEQQGSFVALFDATVQNLDNAMDSILEVRAEVGARLNTVASVDNLHADVNLLAQETLSELRDIDYAEAVSRLNLQSFVLEAAQQSYVRIANLSLFNSL